MSRFPFSSYPVGWYRVAFSADLARGKVVPLRYFGNDLVMFRGESGEAHVLDAHCPHLGAHLGHGGCVVGETVQCPFHGWRIDGDGQCVHIPYAEKIPPRAQIRSWPALEENGVIFVHHHPTGAAPTFEIPRFDEFENPAWTPLVPIHRWELRAHVSDFAENACDATHSGHLHDVFTHSAHTVSVEQEGAIIRHKTSHHYSVFKLVERLGTKVTGLLESTCYGFGCIGNRAHVDAGKLKLEYFVIFYPTPIDHDRVEVQVAVTMRRLPSRIATRLLLWKASRETVATIDQDVPIWENKAHREKPLLTEGEGALAEFRRWARQFYPIDEPLKIPLLRA